VCDTSSALIDAANGIIAGHGRAEAAKLLGMSDVPTVRVDHLTPAQIRAYVIADNRLAHADDLVAHVQERESWDVLSFPAIAEKDEMYDVLTPYGRRQIHRKTDEILQPTLLSASLLADLRRGMTEYNFAAQFQQDPQPPSGNIVKRKWLKYYGPDEKPERFHQIIQSWDTANKDSERSNYSVCTAWGVKRQHLYLLDVYRRKVDLPSSISHSSIKRNSSWSKTKLLGHN